MWRSPVARRFCSSPLSGRVVVDLTRVVAGPFCTQLLGDLGATVVKVESRAGDETRRWGPPFVGDSAETCYFVSLNRNKRSVCVDLKHPLGKTVLHDLAANADVLVENFIPGKLDSLGVGYDELKRIAPHLIYCSITGYGSTGPYAKRPGYDVIAAGVGGLLSFTGEESGGPVKVGVAVTDIATGLYAYGSILAAMLLRNSTGKGQKIDCNLLSTQIASLINIGSNYLNASILPKRQGTAHANIVPYQAFPTKNGHIIIGAGSNEHFKALCEILDILHISADVKFSSNVFRVQNRAELIKILENKFMEKSTEEWLSALEGAPFPYGPINTLDKVFKDPHVQHLDLVEEMYHPVAGKVKIVKPPVTFNDGGNKVRSRPPLLGEHTDEILSGLLGYDKNKIIDLRKEGAIF